MEWSAYFSAGGAFQQNLPRLEKACIFLGYSLDWNAKVVTQAAKGLARYGGRINASKPAVSRTLLVKILNRSPLSGAFAQAAWVS